MLTSTPDVSIEDDAPVGTAEDIADDRDWRKRRVRHGSKLHGKLVAALNEDMAFSQRGKMQRDELARRSYKAYRCAIDLATHNMAVKLREPQWFTSVHTSVCREMAAHFASPRLFSYRPRGATTLAEARMFSRLVDVYWESADAYQKIYDLVLQRQLYGTSYYYCFWDEKWRSVGRFLDTEEPVTETDENGDEFVIGTVPKRVYKKEREKVKDGPNFLALNFLECYPDWESPTVEDGRFFCFSKFRSRQYVREMARSGHWDKAQVRLALESPWAAGNPDIQQGINTVIGWQQEIGMLSADSVALASKGEIYEVTQRWTQKGVTTYLNRTFVVDHGENPFSHGEIPVGKLTGVPAPGEHFGVSSFEVVESQLIHLDTMSSAGATEARLSVHPVLLVGPAVKQDQLVYAPGRQWRVPDPAKDVVPLVRPSHGIEVADSQAANARALINDALATSEALRGSLPGREQTASAVNLSERGAGIRQSATTKLFHEQFSRRVGHLWRAMIQQFHDVQVAIRLTDDPNSPPAYIGHDDVYGLDLDTVPNESDVERDEIQVKRLLDFATACLNFGVKSIDIDALMSTAAELLIPQYTQLIIKSPERMAMEAQQQAMQQMQQAQQPGQPQAAPGQNNMDNLRGGPPASTGGRVNKGNDGGVEQIAKETAAVNTL